MKYCVYAKKFKGFLIQYCPFSSATNVDVVILTVTTLYFSLSV